MKLEVLAKSDNREIQKTIITAIRDVINKKNLEPGEKLPSERMLSEKLGVSRSNIREAIQILEFYGILKSIPQSGTFVANIGVTAMNGMIEDIIRLADPDFKSLVETRILLELKTSRLAAIRRTKKDLQSMRSALDAYNAKVIKGEDAVQEDLLFHLAIAKASGNSTMNRLMLIITPGILTNFEKYHVCDENQAYLGMQEHEEIYNAIEKQDPKLAKEKMKINFMIVFDLKNNNFA